MQDYSRLSKTAINLLLTILITLSTFSGAYYFLRYKSYIMEVDASRQTLSADGILQTKSLNNSAAYNNGMAYSAIQAMLSLITGLEIQTVQLGSGMAVFILFLVVFITFREILGSAGKGLLASFLLLLQPDFMFYVIRGSHERVTWTFMLLILFLLIRSQKEHYSIRQSFVYIFLIYLTFWALVLSNVFFASTFLTAIVLVFILGNVIDHLFLSKEKTHPIYKTWRKRLFILMTACFILVYLCITFTYQPAKYMITVFDSLIDKLSVILLNFEASEDITSYTYFSSAWQYKTAYFLVTASQWTIALCGFGAWFGSLFHLMHMNFQKRLLWQFYTAFGLLLLMGVLADLAGFLNENLQLRLFTPFTLFSSAMLVVGLEEQWPKLKWTLKRILIPSAGFFAVFSFIFLQLKITNDPLIANVWLFYSPAEVIGYQWMERTLNNQVIWVDTWDHLGEVFNFKQGFNQKKNNAYYYSPNTKDAEVFLWSERLQAESQRRGTFMPTSDGVLCIYDNGAAKVYLNPEILHPLIK